MGKRRLGFRLGILHARCRDVLLSPLAVPTHVCVSTCNFYSLVSFSPTLKRVWRRRRRRRARARNPISHYSTQKSPIMNAREVEDDDRPTAFFSDLRSRSLSTCVVRRVVNSSSSRCHAGLVLYIDDQPLLFITQTRAPRSIQRVVVVVVAPALDVAASSRRRR